MDEDSYNTDREEYEAMARVLSRFGSKGPETFYKNARGAGSPPDLTKRLMRDFFDVDEKESQRIVDLYEPQFRTHSSIINGMTVAWTGSSQNYESIDGKKQWVEYEWRAKIQEDDWRFGLGLFCIESSKHEIGIPEFEKFLHAFLQNYSQILTELISWHIQRKKSDDADRPESLDKNELDRQWILENQFHNPTVLYHFDESPKRFELHFADYDHSELNIPLESDGTMKPE